MEKDIKEFIINMDDFSNNEISGVCLEILNVTDEELRKELLQLFLNRIIEYFKSDNTYTENEIIEKINSIIRYFSVFNETDEILKDNEFTVENVMNKINNKINNEEIDINDEEIDINQINQENNLEKKEIDIIENSIKELEEKQSYLVNDELYSLSIDELNKQITDYNEEFIKIENMKNRKYYKYSTDDIENRINELENWLDNVRVNVLTKKLSELNNTRITKYHSGFQVEPEKKDDFNKLMNEIDLLNKELESEKKKESISIEDLKNELFKLENSNNIISSLTFGDEKLKKDHTDKNLKIKELKKMINEKEEKKNKESELIELKKELIQRNESLYIEEDNIESYVNDINKKINEINNVIKAKNSKEYLLSTDEIENKINEIKDNLNNTKLNQLVKRLNELNTEKLNKYFSGLQLEPDEKIKYDSLLNEINLLKEEIAKEKKYEEELNNTSIDELKSELEKLENPVNVISSLTFGDTDAQKKYETNKQKIKYLKKLIQEKEKRNLLKQQLNDLTNELNYRNNLLNPEEKERLNYLSNIRNAYNMIIEDAIKKFNNNELEDVEEFVNNHRDIETINNYENSDKLKKELINDIKNKLNLNEIKNEENKITKKYNDKIKWMKAIGGIATGLVAGLAFSCIPGNHIVLIAAPLVKLGMKGINKVIDIHCKNNPEGKIADIKNSQKYQNIKNNIKRMKDKLNESKLSYVLNGYTTKAFYVGAIAGNIISATTGETILEHIFGDNSNNVISGTTGNMTTESIVESNTDKLLSPNTLNASDLAGHSYDLSSVPQGFVSSYSDTPVNLITESAKNLSFDKANFVNGEEWWHFLKPDGQGYAWFKADDVRHLVEGAIKSGKSI